MIGLTAAEGSFDILVEMVAVNQRVLLAWVLSTNSDATGSTTDNSSPSGIIKTVQREEKVKGKEVTHA